MGCSTLTELQKTAADVKKETIKAGYIKAVKDLIFSEGVGAVTARRLGEITGYSYATVYHYFDDLNGLLLEAKLSMIHDMTQIEEIRTDQSQDPLQRFKQNTRIPVDFFIQNPNVFRFFYTYPLDARNESAMRSLEIEKNYYSGFFPFVESGIIKESDIPVLSRTILYTVYGLITLYLSDNGLTKEEIYSDLDQIIDFLLNRSNAT